MAIFNLFSLGKQRRQEAKILSLPSLALLNPITHVLAFYDEAPSKMRELLDNALMLHECFCDLYSASPGDFHYSYKLVVTFPESRVDLLKLANEYKQKMKQQCINYVINEVKKSDMSIEGKEGVLACTQWLFGPVLIKNEKPYSASEAIDLLLKAK